MDYLLRAHCHRGGAVRGKIAKTDGWRGVNAWLGVGDPSVTVDITCHRCSYELYPRQQHTTLYEDLSNSKTMIFNVKKLLNTMLWT